MEAHIQNNPAEILNDMFRDANNSAQSRTAPLPVSPQVAKPVSRPAPAPKTVLVVDDERDYRELVKHLLSVHHYRVLEASNGLEALALINKLNPDLVLLDFNMPTMNGYELIQEVRSNDATRKMRMIMFTGAVNKQHLRTLNMDISDFLEKPVTNAKLLESIAKALGTAAPPHESQPAPRPKLSVTAPVEVIEPVPPVISVERFEQPIPAPQVIHRSEPQPPAPAQVPAALIELPAAALPSPEPEARIEVPEIDMAEMANEHELELLDSGTARKEDVQDTQGLENLVNDSPLIQRVNKILMAAVDKRASDIHIEPSDNRVTIRIRVDGELRALTTLPISIHPRLTARIKIMSSLSITERRLPQDGQFRVQIRGQKIEFRVSTLPCVKGEKIVMRILGQSKLNTDLSQLDLTPRELKAVQGALRSANGLILVTGPTGSGKTTTLYTMINVLNRPEVNIMTAEDPVEYEVPNVNQVKILSGIGLTFEATLRAFLRQDPDIMLVGEIRDLETAEISIKASITGHLVFSTLHTNSAPATVVRLTHMGVAPYLVAASVKMVIAQRLVRTLCPHCRILGVLNDEEKKILTEKEVSMLKTVFLPAGCDKCSQGYSGRKAVFEIMPIETSAMRTLITTSNNVDLLSDLAVNEGMTTLRQSALDAVRQGRTSLREALKIMMG